MRLSPTTNVPLVIIVIAGAAIAADNVSGGADDGSRKAVPSSRPASPSSRKTPAAIVADEGIERVRTDLLAHAKGELADEESDLQRLQKAQTDLLRGGKRGDRVRDRRLKDLRDEMTETRKRIAELRASINTLPKASGEQLARAGALQKKAEQLAQLRRRFSSAVSASDYVVKEIVANGEVRSASRRGIVDTGEITKAIFYGNGGLVDKSKDANRQIPFARVAYEFEFMTKAGLIRQHVGEVLVGEIDGIWQAIEYTVDGITSERYPLALRKYLLDLEAEAARDTRNAPASDKEPTNDAGVNVEVKVRSKVTVGVQVEQTEDNTGAAKETASQDRNEPASSKRGRN